MINVNIEGTSWSEVTEQLTGLIRKADQPCDDGAAMAERIYELKADLEAAGVMIDDRDARIKELLEIVEAREVRIAELEQLLATPEEGDTKNPTPAAEPAPETSETAAPTEPEPAAEVAPAPATTEQPKYDKVQVREFLAECRNRGVNITDVLKPFGGRFPVVKEKDYPALMEAAKKALAEKGAK